MFQSTNSDLRRLSTKTRLQSPASALNRRSVGKCLSLLAGMAVLIGAPKLAAQEMDMEAGHAAMMDAGPAPEYRAYAGDGTPIDLEAIISAALDVDVLLLGETHNDPAGHWLQTELFRQLVHATEMSAEVTRTPVLSMEMFETDVQYILDEYLRGEIAESHFLASARPWTDYETDYKPIVEYAKSHTLPVVAANAPRRYVNFVSRNGPEKLVELSEMAQSYLPPLPYASPSQPYLAELSAVMGGHGGPELDEETGIYTPASTSWSQALWDASMAHSIAQALIAEPDGLIVHLAGSFHVQNRTGIFEHLIRYRPSTSTVTVVAEPVDDINSFPESLAGEADFILLTSTEQLRESSGGDD